MTETRLVDLKIYGPNTIKEAERQFAFYSELIRRMYWKPTKPPWVRKSKRKTVRY